MKVCPKCKELKPNTEFYNDKRSKDGLTSSCKDCHKKYRNENKHVSKQWYDNNKDYYKKRMTNPIVRNRYNELRRERYKDNLIENRKLGCVKFKQKKTKDPLFAIIVNVRCMIHTSLKNKGYSKTSKTYEILGCTYEEFKKHIENKFVDGMSWDNRHLWDIDHNIPISWGKTEEDIIKLNHYSNLQPLWKEDNKIKGDRYAGDTKTILEMHESLGIGYLAKTS